MSSGCLSVTVASEWVVKGEINPSDLVVRVALWGCREVTEENNLTKLQIIKWIEELTFLKNQKTLNGQKIG